MDPCEEYRVAMEQARQAYDEAQRRARAEVVSEPLEPLNMPPALKGTMPDEPPEEEKEARKRLDQATQAYEDCIKSNTLRK